MCFYDNFLSACSDKQVTPAQVRKALKISQSTMASWKSRSLTPKYGTVKKIADYLQVDWTDLVPEEEQAGTVITHIKEKLGTGTPFVNVTSSLTAKKRIEDALSKLNDVGQQKAVERVEELTEIPKYQRQETPPEAPQDPPEGE